MNKLELLLLCTTLARLMFASIALAIIAESRSFILLCSQIKPISSDFDAEMCGRCTCSGMAPTSEGLFC